MENRSTYPRNPGYDNQPYFLPDGKSLIYSSAREDDQTEIVEYFIGPKVHNRITRSAGSEYSPTLTPDGAGISTIILEKDGTQLLWKYPREGGRPELLVEDLKIGYHCWYDENTIVSFVLGEPATLQVSSLESKTNHIVQPNPGRSLHKIPGKKLVSFVDKRLENDWKVLTFDPATGKMEPLFTTLPGIEDMAWATERIAIMASSSTLYISEARRGH